MELEQELRDHLRQFDPPPEPRASDDEIVADLRALEDESEHEPPQPEPEPVDDEPLETGQLILTYRRAVIRRDEQGRIKEIVEGNSRKFIRRDLVTGIPYAIDEVVETEEVEEPEEE